MQTLKRVLHSLSCGKFKVLKRIAAGASEVPGEKEKGAGGLIKPTDSFIFNAAFRYDTAPALPPSSACNCQAS
jgi:hypothetical protein